MISVSVSIFKKKIFDDREREQGLDHSEQKRVKNAIKGEILARLSSK